MRYSIQHDNITTTASVGKVGPGLSHSPRGMGCHKTTILSAPKRLLTLDENLNTEIVLYYILSHLQTKLRELFV